MFIIAYLHQMCHLAAKVVSRPLAYIVSISFIKLNIMGTFSLTVSASTSNVNDWKHNIVEMNTSEY